MNKKKIVWLVVGLVCIVVIGINLVKDSFVENAIKSQVKNALGMDVSIDEVNVGLLGANLRLEGLTITNTDEFGGKDFIRIPLFYIDSDLLSLIGGEKNINEIKLHVADVGIVKNREGELNLGRLKALGAAKEKSSDDVPEDAAGGIGIDQVILTFDQVAFYDLSTGTEPEELIIPVRMSHQTFKNMHSPQQVGQAVVMAAVLEGTAEEGGMDRIFTLGDHLKVLGGPEMEQKLNEFKEKFNTQAKDTVM